MILIENYEIERDARQWILTEKRPGKANSGEDIISKRITYHSTLPGLCKTLLERECGKCDDVEGLKELFDGGVDRIIAAMEKVER
jgi:hypothetical protein